MRRSAPAAIGLFLLALSVSGCGTDAGDTPSAAETPTSTQSSPTASEPASRTPSAEPTPVESTQRHYSDNTWYVAYRDPATGSFDTWVGVSAEQDVGVGEVEFYLNVSCQKGQLFFFMVAPGLFYETEVSYWIDDRPAVREWWGATADGGDPGLQPDDTPGFVESLRGGERLEFQVHGDAGLLMTFDIRHLFSTRVQPNIDNCGLPGWR